MLEVGVPACEFCGEGVVEDAGADLEEVVSAFFGPAHLLFLDHAFGYDLVHGRFHERGRDRLPGAVALSVVGDRGGVRFDVSAELVAAADKPAETLVFDDVGVSEAGSDVVDCFEGTVDVAVL